MPGSALAEASAACLQHLLSFAERLLALQEALLISGLPQTCAGWISPTMIPMTQRSLKAGALRRIGRERSRPPLQILIHLRDRYYLLIALRTFKNVLGTVDPMMGRHSRPPDPAKGNLLVLKMHQTWLLSNKILPKVLTQEICFS